MAYRMAHGFSCLFACRKTKNEMNSSYSYFSFINVKHFRFFFTHRKPTAHALIMFPYYTETRANQFVAQRNRNASYAAVLGYNN